MIEIVLSYLNRARKRINTIIETGTADMYGTGELGNVYYGPAENANVPDVINFDTTVFNSNPSLPLSRPAQYRNLYIDTGVTLSTVTDWATILVSDTLYLRGTISASNTHSGNYVKTDMVPDKLSKLRLFGETTYLANTPFLITGGTNNPCFGNSSRGGGFVGVYYSGAYALSSENTFGTEFDSISGFVNVSGALSGPTKSGGCLIIAARNIAFAENSHIYNYGGAISDPDNATAGILCQYKMSGRTQL